MSEISLYEVLFGFGFGCIQCVLIVLFVADAVEVDLQYVYGFVCVSCLILRVDACFMLRMC